MTPWTIAAVTWSTDRVYVTLERGSERRVVYMTAGIIAAQGLSGPPLYDGKVVATPEGAR